MWVTMSVDLRDSLDPMNSLITSTLIPNIDSVHISVLENVSEEGRILVVSLMFQMLKIALLIILWKVNLSAI